MLPLIGFLCCLIAAWLVWVMIRDHINGQTEIFSIRNAIKIVTACKDQRTHTATPGLSKVNVTRVRITVPTNAERRKTFFRARLLADGRTLLYLPSRRIFVSPLAELNQVAPETVA